MRIDNTPSGGKSALDQLGGTTAGIIGAFTAAVGGLGFTGSGLGALVRNHKLGSTLGLMALAVAIAFAVGSILAERKNQKTGNVLPAARKLQVGAAITFVVGLFLIIWTAVSTASDKYQPSIAASFVTNNNVLSLESEVKANGLGAREHVSVRIFPIANGERGPALYLGDQGPDTNGNVTSKISLPVRLGMYDRVLIMAWVGRQTPECDPDLPKKRVELGCASLPVPSGSLRPELTVSVDGDGDARALMIKVGQSAVTDSTRVIVLVSGNISGRANSPIYSTIISSDAAGRVDATLRVPSPNGATDICVAATALTGDLSRRPGCPPQADADTSWALIGGPIVTSTK